MAELNEDSAFESVDQTFSARNSLQSSINGKAVVDDVLERLDDGEGTAKRSNRDETKDSDAESAAATITQSSKATKVKLAAEVPPVPPFQFESGRTKQRIAVRMARPTGTPSKPNRQTHCLLQPLAARPTNS